ncbi:MAG TPA: TIGR03013 family XrtA/PEP-CTERM system glycosyltransferase [Steroidobacteraceae bacterium]
MRLKLLGNYWNPTFALLWTVESAAVLYASRIAWQVRAPYGVAHGWAQSWVFVALVLFAMASMGLFNHRLRDRTAGIVLRISISVLAGGMATALALALWSGLRVPVSEIAIAAVVSWLFLVLVRIAARGAIDRSPFRRRVLVLGGGHNAALILKLRRRADRRGFKLVGFVPVEGEDLQVPVERVVQVGESMRGYAIAQRIGEVVVAVEDRRRSFPLRALLECRFAGIEIVDLASFLERETGRVHLSILSPSWLIFGGGCRNDALRRSVERLFDYIASGVFLCLASPVMLLTALAIKLEDGFRAPVFYYQARVGYLGRTIQVCKFRSMRMDAECDGCARWASINDKRVTKVGWLIRKARIDELPQLINVFRGQMSFVGPRPERPEFVAQLAQSIPYYERRHAVKPGITGWAQLCYPYGCSERDALEKLQYDLYYVKHHGLIFDLLILLQTVEVIVLGRGAR